MKTLGKEMNNKEELAFLLPHLNNHENLKILDIGCGENGVLLSNIYNAFTTKISKLIGVDNKKLKLHNNNFSDNHNSIVGNEFMIEGLVDIFKDDGFTFINNIEINQDLIIFSNFLHLHPWEKSKEVIQTALTKLSHRGIIYIKVRNKALKEGKSYPFDKNIIEEISKFSEIILDPREIGVHYNMIIKNIETV